MTVDNIIRAWGQRHEVEMSIESPFKVCFIQAIHASDCMKTIFYYTSLARVPSAGEEIWIDESFNKIITIKTVPAEWSENDDDEYWIYLVPEYWGTPFAETFMEDSEWKVANET
jgi:hypothetical protein